jgi:hypothetical protein
VAEGGVLAAGAAVVNDADDPGPGSIAEQLAESGRDCGAFPWTALGLPPKMCSYLS